MSNVQKELAWGYVREIKAICQPLFDKLKINYFDYSRFYPDNTAFGLFTDPEYVSFFRNHETYKSGPKQVLLPGKHLWQSYIDSDFLGEASNYFEHDHGLTIISEYPDYVEICNFATTPENKRILDLYLNGDDFIYRFIGYFKNQADRIIRHCAQQPVIIMPEPAPDLTDQFKVQDIITELSLDDHFLVEQFGSMQPLTKREAQCLSGLLKGKTNKAIAMDLELSPRTVDTHMDKIKNKLVCHSKSDIVRKIQNKAINLNWEV